MRTEPTHRPVAGIELADGSCWRLVAEDGGVRQVLAELVHRMQLGPAPASARTLFLATGGASQGTPMESQAENDNLRVHLKPIAHSRTLFTQLQLLGLVIAGECEKQGGVLLHGALAEYDGRGVILAGPGGVGKTTASRRLPQPWQSLSDDTTMVVCDRDGDFRAHPWPSWTRLSRDRSSESWDIQHSLPLAGVFFLVQDEKEHLEPLASGQAVCLLNESIEQATRAGLRGLAGERRRAIRLRQLDTAMALATAVPCHLLRLSLTGSFWKELEKTFERSSQLKQIPEHRRNPMRISA